MAILVRMVEGKIYHTKFDDLDGWTEEEDLRNTPWGYWGPWGDLSSTYLCAYNYYSSPYSLCARIQSKADAGDLPAGRYLRRYRTVTIPSGLSQVRMQVRHAWYRSQSTMAMARRVRLGDQLFLDQNPTDAQSTWFLKNDVVSTSAGDKVLKVGVESYATVSPSATNFQDHYFDELVICRSGNILVKGLSSGWKAKIYDLSDTLIAGATESGGTATINVSASAYPIVGLIKIYDGSDMLQFTSEMFSDIFGGDEFLFSSGGHTLSPSTDQYIINRKGTGSPTQAAITFVLKDALGSPVAGKTVTFKTSKGMLSAASDVTSGEEYGFATVGSQSYPRVEDGITTTGGDTTIGAANTWFTKLTITGPKTVKAIHIYIATAVGNKRLSLYDNSNPNVLLGQTDVFVGSNGAWAEISLLVPAHIVTGAATFWLGITEINGNLEHYHYTVGSAGDAYQTATSYVTAGFPATLDIDALTSSNIKVHKHTSSVQIKGFMKRGSKFTLPSEKEIYAVKIHSHIAVGNARVAVFDEQSPKNKKWESGSVALSVGSNVILISSGTPNTLTLPAADHGVWWQYNDVGDAPSYTAGAAGDGRYLAQAYGAFPATISGDTSTTEKWTETLVIGGAGAGEAHTTLESTFPGVAIVKGEWAGDAANPRCWNTIEISIHEAPDSPDGSKLYDVWVQGRKLNDVVGIALSSREGENVATITVARLDKWIQGFYDFCVYRYGSAVFFGRVEVIQRKVDPEEETVIEGRTMVQSLMRIPVENVGFTAQTLKAIIESIHATYVEPTKQVPLGSIAEHLQNITTTITISNVMAYDAFSTVASLGASKIHVGADRKLNVK